MIYQIPIKTLPNVLKVGHIRYSSGWSETYTHKWNVLFFVVSGRFLYSFSSKHQVTLTAGMHLLVPAGVSYQVTATEDCDYYFASFNVSGSLSVVADKDVVQFLNEETERQRSALNREYDTAPCDSIYIVESYFHGDQAPKLQHQISRCAEYRYGSAPLDRMRLLNSFYTLLLSLASATGEQLLDTKQLSPTLIKLTRYIEENYTSQLSLQVLSSHFSMSKQYIMRLFREQFGMTVTHYINDVRLRKSLELLTFHPLSISEIAYAVGFSSLYYFDRLFKNTYAITPTEYQRTHNVIARSVPVIEIRNDKQD